MAAILDLSCLESQNTWKTLVAEHEDFAEEPGTVSPSSFVYPNVHDVSLMSRTHTLMSLDRWEMHAWWASKVSIRKSTRRKIWSPVFRGLRAPRDTNPHKLLSWKIKKRISSNGEGKH